MISVEPVSLSVLTGRVTRALAVAPGLNDVWIVAETSDLRCSGGHCYMELIEKDASGRPLAKCRAAIWASTYARLSAAFVSATGTTLRSDMKIMAKVNVSFHAVYGMCLVITDINPDYTVGDLARKRNAIIAQLKKDGVYDLNRSLPWVPVPNRVAIISAKGAAGFGDFMKHLHNNPLRLRFSTDLYEANLQGERTVPTVIAALEAIMECVDDYDCVVIIRGGGAVSDLSAFDDYSLAYHLAQFPLPVIVGIGHERDITVLDYVANKRVKTPTAAAELLLRMVGDAYGRVFDTGRSILDAVRAAVAGRRQQLAYCQGLLPVLSQNVIERNRRKVGAEASRIISDSVTNVLARNKARLSALGELLDAISPEATLRRGYSITRIGGKAVTDSSSIAPGDVIETVFAKGPAVKSTVGDLVLSDG